MTCNRETVRAQDEALVERCRRREGAAWSELVQRYGPLLRSVLRPWLRTAFGRVDAQLVEDQVQEVWRSLLVNDMSQLHQYDSRRAGLSTFLVWRARQCFLNYLDLQAVWRQAREKPLAEDPLLDDPAELHLLQMCWNEFLHGLPDELRRYCEQHLPGRAAVGPDPGWSKWERSRLKAEVWRRWRAFCHRE